MLNILAWTLEYWIESLKKLFIVLCQDKRVKSQTVFYLVLRDFVEGFRLIRGKHSVKLLKGDGKFVVNKRLEIMNFVRLYLHSLNLAAWSEYFLEHFQCCYFDFSLVTFNTVNEILDECLGNNNLSFNTGFDKLYRLLLVGIEIFLDCGWKYLHEQMQYLRLVGKVCKIRTKILSIAFSISLYIAKVWVYLRNRFDRIEEVRILHIWAISWSSRRGWTVKR